jgi:hypothetical protein
MGSRPSGVDTVARVYARLPWVEFGLFSADGCEVGTECSAVL